jgi:hypothetical protein
MIGRSAIFVLVAGAVLFGTEQIARAGLISPVLAGHGNELLPLSDSSSSTGVGTSPRDRGPSSPSWLEVNGLVTGILGIPAGGGGMSAPPTGSGASAPVSVLNSDVVEQSDREIVVWGFLSEQMLTLPPPFASRFFRPPRA